MSAWDSIFGVVAGPIALLDTKNKQARAAAIAAVGGLGGTGLEAAAGEDAKTVQSGLATDQVLGSIAATVGTLGAAAPAAASADAATIGADTAAEGAATTAATATPAIASAAPEVASTATPTVATSLPMGGISTETSPIVPASETAIDEVSGAGGQVNNLKNAKDAFNIGKTTYSTINQGMKATQDQPNPIASMPTYKPPVAVDPTASTQFSTIFGKPDVTNQGMNPVLSQTSVPGLPSAIAPMIAPLIQTPQRSMTDFMTQINGAK
jgi:hypothetical protein